MFNYGASNFILLSMSRESLDNLPFGIYIINQKGVIEFFNKEMAKMSGVKDGGKVEGQNIFQIPTYKKYGLLEYIKKGLGGQPFRIEEIKYVSHVGKKESIRSYYGLPSKDEKGRVKKLFCIVEDVTAQKRLARQIKEVLREREVLLREINHRVKNNMQIIYSLINLQSSRVKDREALKLIEESKNQIKSMLLVHEGLYRRKDLAKINFWEYISNLTDNLFTGYCIDRSRVVKKIDIDKNIYLGVDKAIPCALIVNELITNALKYAFPDKKQGEIFIKFKKINNDNYKLTVGDNGVGSTGGKDKKAVGTLGLELVDVMVKQIYGSLKTDTKNGMVFIIKFPVSL